MGRIVVPGHCSADGDAVLQPGGFFQPEESFVPGNGWQMLLPKGAAVVVASVEIMVAGHQEFGAGEVSEELQPAAEEAQRVAHIAGQDEDIRLLRGGPLGEGQVRVPGCRLVVEVGRD